MSSDTQPRDNSGSFNKGMGIGFALGLLAGLVLSGLVAGSFVLNKISDPAFWESIVEEDWETGPLMNAELTIPDTATLGEPFQIEVAFSNQHDVAATLDSIDISEELLVGLKIDQVEPSPSSTYEMFEMKTYEFETEYQPGETGLVRFTVTPMKEGTFSGDIDFRNPEQDYHSFTRDVTVAKP